MDPTVLIARRGKAADVVAVVVAVAAAGVAAAETAAAPETLPHQPMPRADLHQLSRVAVNPTSRRVHRNRRLLLRHPAPQPQGLHPDRDCSIRHSES